jgi:hypothetical protein
MMGLVLLAGCGVTGGPMAELSVVGRDQFDAGDRQSKPQRIAFDQAIYRYEDHNTVTVLLLAGPAEDRRQVVAFRMFWRPSALSTPVDDTGTNVVVRMMRFPESTDAAAGPVGIYAGAGFLRVRSDPTTGTFEGVLEDADLRLIDASPEFIDTLGRSTLAGTFTAERDDTAVGTALRDLNLTLTDRLGYPRLVSEKRQPDSDI